MPSYFAITTTGQIVPVRTNFDTISFTHSTPPSHVIIAQGEQNSPAHIYEEIADGDIEALIRKCTEMNEDWFGWHMAEICPVLDIEAINAQHLAEAQSKQERIQALKDELEALSN